MEGLSESQSKLDYDLSRSSWIGDYNDANTFLDMFMTNNGNNRTGWSNAHYDALIRAANEQTDKRKRRETFSRSGKDPGCGRSSNRAAVFLRRIQLLQPTNIEGIYPNILDNTLCNAYERRVLRRRIAALVPLLLVISLLGFLVVRQSPGGPFDRERVPASPEIERNLNARYHLDEPIWKQYLRYLANLVRGDLGPSLKYRNHTVNDIIAQALPVSMTLGALAFTFAMGLGLPIGFFAALRRGRWQDYAGSLFALLTVCIPGLVLAPLLIVLFGIKLRWLPVGFGSRRCMPSCPRSHWACSSRGKSRG